MTAGLVNIDPNPCIAHQETFNSAVKMMSSVLFAAATVMSVASQHAAVLATGTQTCKCIPGDDCWPTAQEWEAFNATVSGKLVTPRQLASACHNPDYDEATCQYVREQWTQPYLQLVSRFTPKFLSNL